MKGNRPDDILRVLQKNGYEAFYVGGCVRDMLLGRPVHDWDITTSALPEEIMACFEKSVPTGGRHGTVTVIFDGIEAEVTTYRTEGLYLDGRHPENISFVKDLRQDLVRRDFTVNAMAMDENGRIVDLFGGREDLEKKLIRCVGEPERRFREDALRMFRAMRFSAQLGFSLEEETSKAIRRCADLCEKLSAERIRDEIEKILYSHDTGKLDEMASFGMLARFCPTVKNSCQWISRLSPEPVVRWAGLCRTWPQMNLDLMRLSKKVTKAAQEAAQCAAPASDLEWKLLIAEKGTQCAYVVGEVEGCVETVHRILSSGHCLSLRDLAVSGADLPGRSGPEVGQILQKLLLHVFAHPDDNKKEILMKLL